MPTCTGHRRISGQALGMCIRCQHLHPNARRQLDVPQPGHMGVWGCPQFAPLQPLQRDTKP